MELSDDIKDRRLNRSKSYATIHGRPDACPNAAFTQNGVYFDQQGMPLGGEYIAVDDQDVIESKDELIARLMAENAALKSPEKVEDDVPEELDREELMQACKEKGIKVIGNMKTETLYKKLQDHADSAA